jgi:hypothetical protein
MIKIFIWLIYFRSDLIIRFNKMITTSTSNTRNIFLLNLLFKSFFFLKNSALELSLFSPILSLVLEDFKASSLCLINFFIFLIII